MEDKEPCIFCKIIRGEEEKKLIKDYGDFMVIDNKYPNAPIHFLIIPKDHHKDITSFTDDMWVKVRRIAVGLMKQKNLDGFRLTVNSGTAAAIHHAHIHFMAGIDAQRGL